MWTIKYKTSEPNFIFLSFLYKVKYYPQFNQNQISGIETEWIETKIKQLKLIGEKKKSTKIDSWKVKFHANFGAHPSTNKPSK